MSVTNAVYSTVTLLQQGVVGVIGDISSSWTSLSALISSTLEIPQCSFTANAVALSDKSQYKYFFRTIPTQVLIADVMLEFAAKEGWKKLGVLYTDDPLGQQFYQRAIIQAGTMDIHITQYQSIANPDQTESLTNALNNLTHSGARVIMVAGTTTSKVIMRAQQLGLLNENYVWLLLGDTESALQAGVETYNTQNTQHLNYAKDFQGLFMFDNWLSLYGYPPFDAFLDQWSKLDANILAYSCMMIMAKGYSRLISSSHNQTAQLTKLASGGLGDELLPPTFNVNYIGPEGPMIYDSNGDLTTGYA
ncbi:periplasmic binding protein-like I [Sporodiniella umbellata]|nr:periplasmic binding protein-like I [Sporodiniella umbellata]